MPLFRVTRTASIDLEAASYDAATIEAQDAPADAWTEDEYTAELAEAD